MNYFDVYDKLINRSKERDTSSTEYYELHHIIPRCMQGSDVKDNLVLLTAREHYIAHQLLVKMYPSNTKLIYAANMMTVDTLDRSTRSKNRRYEWLRKKYAKACSIKQTGKGNNGYGSTWITNFKTKQSIRIDKTDLDTYIEQGWVQKRKINFDAGVRVKTFTCIHCQTQFSKNTAYDRKFCSKQCEGAHVFYSCTTYKLFVANHELIKQWCKEGFSCNKICKNLGLIGSQGGYYLRLKRFLSESGITA